MIMNNIILISIATMLRFSCRLVSIITRCIHNIYHWNHAHLNQFLLGGETERSINIGGILSEWPSHTYVRGKYCEQWARIYTYSRMKMIMWGYVERKTLKRLLQSKCNYAYFVKIFLSKCITYIYLSLLPINESIIIT